MDVNHVINTLLNLVWLPVTFFSILLFYPPYLFLKSILFFIRCLFSEDMADKVVLITGASSGIGEHVAYEYARRGACLVLAARRVEKLEHVAEMARSVGSPDVIQIQADVAKQDDCKRIIDETITRFGKLDHLVNNAGIASVCLLEDSEDVEDMKPVMDVNFWGSIYMTRFALPHLRYSRGKIVVISSIAAWLPLPRMTVYNASKAALLIAYETLRAELGRGVGITIVTPGFIESEITRGKFLEKGGRTVVDAELRDVMISLAPVLSVERCALEVVNSACRGDRYLTVPDWMRATYWWKVFFPEVMELFYWLVYTTTPGTPSAEALSKKVLDVSGGKWFLYPSSILTSEGKTE